MKNIQSSKRGFTIIELAIVVLISGIVIGLMSAGLAAYLRQGQLQETQQRIDIIDKAISQYLAINGKLPCPASLEAPVDSPQFGREVDIDCSATDHVGTFRATGRSTGSSTGKIRIGAVPVRSLGLPDLYITDSWARRYVYAVTESQATPGQYRRENGAIAVLDSDDNHLTVPDSSALYVLASHGADGLGGYNLGGVLTRSCASNHLDSENCDNDGVFRKTLISGSADNQHHYDDHVFSRTMTPSDFSIIPPGGIMLFDLTLCPDGWAPHAGAGSAPGTLIYCEKQ